MSTSTPAGFHGWQRRTVLFLAGQTVSLFGSSLVQYAIIWHITLSTSSGVMMTIATLCGFLPQIAISLFAGVWADRYNRRSSCRATGKSGCYFSYWACAR